MASSYLDLYQNSARLVTPGALGSSTSVAFDNYKPSYGTFNMGGRLPTYVAGKQEKVVHDQYNNMYYGTQKQSDLVSGINASIARLEKQLKQGTQTVAKSGWFGQSGGWTSQRLSAQDITAKNNLIKSQQQYLDNINNGMYKQESSTFFDSYDDWTGDWNNVFARRKSNSDTLRRNDMISEENAARANKAKEQDTKVATGSVAKAKKLTPNLEINTGISAAADKLVQSLNKTGLGI